MIQHATHHIGRYTEEWGTGDAATSSKRRVDAFIADLRQQLPFVQNNPLPEDGAHYFQVYQHHVGNARYHNNPMETEKERSDLWSGAAYEAIMQRALSAAMQLLGSDWQLLQGVPEEEEEAGIINNTEMHFGGGGYNVYFRRKIKKNGQRENGGVEVDALVVSPTNEVVVFDAAHTNLSVIQKLHKGIQELPHQKVEKILGNYTHLCHLCMLWIDEKTEKANACVRQTPRTSIIHFPVAQDGMNALVETMEAGYSHNFSEQQFRQYLGARLPKDNCAQMHYANQSR